MPNIPMKQVKSSKPIQISGNQMPKLPPNSLQLLSLPPKVNPHYHLELRVCVTISSPKVSVMLPCFCRWPLTTFVKFSTVNSTSVCTLIPSICLHSRSSTSLPSPRDSRSNTLLEIFASSSILSNPSRLTSDPGGIFEPSEPSLPRLYELTALIGVFFELLDASLRSKSRLKRGRRRGRLPHVMPMLTSRYVQAPGST
jgi:hypothetical protein